MTRLLTRVDDGDHNLQFLLHKLYLAESDLQAYTGGQLDCVISPAGGAPILLREATEALAASESRYRRLVTNIAAVVFELLPDGTIVFVNDAIAKVLQIAPELLTGRNWWELFFPGDQSEKGVLSRALLAGDGVIGHRMVLRAGNGSSVTLEVNTANLFDASGFLERIVGIGIDITDRMRGEEALRRSEEEFRHLAESVPQIVWITRPDGWNIYFNHRWMDYTGLSLEESLGQGWTAPFHPDDQLRAAQAWQSAVDTGGSSSYSLECRLRRADGVYRWWLVRGIPFRDASGNIVKWFGTCTDIHDLKLAESRIIDASTELENLNADLERRVETRTADLVASQEEAIKANLAKSEFLSRMSHELRTPLNAILGFSQILESRNLNARDSECVELIIKGGRHLLGLINEVLDISRIDAGDAGFSVEPVALEELLAESFELMRPLALDLKLKARNQATGLNGAHVLADRQRLKQVLFNLLANAMKYNRPGGEVRLSSRVSSTDHMRIEVQDQGVGLTPEELSKLFVPFERLGAAKTQVEGTGLGLVLSRRLVEAMNGTIGVESTPGQGSTFYIELPLAEVPPDAVKPSGESDEPTERTVGEQQERPFTVLSIEDNLSSAKLIEVILAQRKGIRLLSAMQGGIGIDLARQHRPSLILLDLNLPDMEGREVLSRLRLYPETAQIPVVVVSADAATSQAETLMAAGAIAYLTKPLNVSEVLQLIDERVGKTRDHVQSPPVINI